MAYVMTGDQRREAKIRGKARWFADCIRISNVPCEITEDIKKFLRDENEMSRFERYLVHNGLFKRSDDKWQMRINR